MPLNILHYTGQVSFTCTRAHAHTHTQNYPLTKVHGAETEKPWDKHMMDRKHNLSRLQAQVSAYPPAHHPQPWALRLPMQDSDSSPCDLQAPGDLGNSPKMPPLKHSNPLQTRPPRGFSYSRSGCGGGWAGAAGKKNTSWCISAAIRASSPVLGHSGGT